MSSGLDAMNKEDSNEFQKVSMKEKLSYCFGDPALTVVYTLTYTLLVYFYTDIIGISAGIIGMILMVSRVFDGISDITMGTIIDRTKSKHGKARVWILRLAIPYVVSAVLLMTVPPVDQIIQLIYIFITYNLASTVIYTGISQPFHTLGSLMTRDRHERETISNIRMALSITASMIVTALMLPFINLVADKIGHEQLAWILVTLGISLVSMLILFNTFKNCKERVRVSEKVEKKISLFTSLKLMFSNRYFLIAGGMMLFFTVYQIGIGTVLTYYCEYILGDVNLVMPLSLAEKIPMIILILLLPVLIPRFGKRKLISSGCIIGIVGQISLLFNPTSVFLGVIASILRGVGMAAYYGLSYTLPMDAIEYGQWKTGTRIEGLMFSSMSFGQKFGAGITSALVGLYLDSAGYNGMLATQSASASNAIANTFIYLPFLAYLIMLVIISFYSLDKNYKQMMGELLQREQKGTL